MSASEASETSTPQMLVLGQGDDDHEFLNDSAASSNSSTAASASIRTSPSSWRRRQRQRQPMSRGDEIKQPSLISRLFLSSSKDELVDTNQQDVESGYTSLAEPQNYEGLGCETERAAQIFRLKRAAALKQSLLCDESQLDQSSKTGADVMSSEDALQQDCSFFYRDLEDLTESTETRLNRRTPRFGSLLRQSLNGEASTGASYTYMTSPPILQHYRTRYEQLNQDLAPMRHRHDLELSIGDDDNNVGGETEEHGRSRGVQDYCIVKNDTAEYSSLFYILHGKLLMHLPHDHIRLVMDPDLEPGILSVEQRRRPSDRLDLSESDLETNKEPPPPLHYVLTVPDDLYRRVVGELSDSIFHSNWGLTSSEERKVDIRVALLVLAVVCFLFWVVVLIWGEKQ